MDHIIQLPGNELGNDLIGTDPHGYLSVLKQAIEPMKEDDRFFLCGDLVDRGPESLALIQYLKQERLQGKEIYAVRGNHEDMVLQAIQYAATLEEKALNSSLNNNLREWVKSLQNAAQTYVYGQHDKFIQDTDSKELREDAPYLEVRDLVENGAGWIFNLTPEQRTEVRDFIIPLPYMIRVAEAKTGTVAPFDIVHAAPLAETCIQSALAQKPVTLNERDIGYMTWARLCNEPYREFIEANPSIEEDPTMRTIVKNKRTEMSPMTYVGHNSLGAEFSIYSEIMVANLDSSTFVTQAMLIANHTKKEVNSLQLTPVALLPIHIIEEQLRLKPKMDPCLKVVNKIVAAALSSESLNKALLKTAGAKLATSSSLSTASSVASSNNADILLNNPSDKAVEKNSAVVADADILLNNPSDKAVEKNSAVVADAVEKIPPESLKQFKANYLLALQEKIKDLTPDQRINLARYLLEDKQHPLAQERDYVASGSAYFWRRRADHSHQTRSMHKAIGLLLNGMKSNEAIIIQRSWLKSTKIDIAQSEASIKKEFNFTRYRRYI